MHDHPFLPMPLASPLSRRGFLTQAGVVVGVFTLPCAFTTAALSSTHHAHVVALHADQPYIDMTGTAVPHLACCVTGGAVPLAAMSEVQLRMQHPYL